MNPGNRNIVTWSWIIERWLCFFTIIHYYKYFWALQQHFSYMHAKMCHDHINPVTPHLVSFSSLLGSFLFPSNTIPSTFMSFWILHMKESTCICLSESGLSGLARWWEIYMFSWKWCNIVLVEQNSNVCVVGAYMSGVCMGGRFFIHICCSQVVESQRHSDTCSKQIGIY